MFSHIYKVYTTLYISIADKFVTKVNIYISEDILSSSFMIIFWSKTRLRRFIMKVNAVDNTSFGHAVNGKAPFYGPVKNTFKRQISTAKADHLEAIARLHYMKYGKTWDALEEIDPIASPLQFLKTFVKMGYHKLKSVDYDVASFHERHRYDEELLNRNRSIYKNEKV